MVAGVSFDIQTVFVADSAVLISDGQLNYTVDPSNGGMGSFHLFGKGNSYNLNRGFHDRHSGGSNVVWGDGHVSFEYDAIYSLRTKDGEPSDYWFRKKKNKK